MYAYDGTLAKQETFYLVGYGQSGDGVNGYYVRPSFSVKRLGNNIADTLKNRLQRRNRKNIPSGV